MNFDFNNNDELDAFDLCILDEIEKDIKEEDIINNLDNSIENEENEENDENMINKNILYDFKDDIVIEKN